jgi:uncharacterized protein (UPF0335 family)
MTTVASYRIPGFGTVEVVQQNDGRNRFWDLFAASGECLNEGHPFWSEPQRKQVETFLAHNLKEALARIERECESIKITQEDLDEVIHEAAQAGNRRLNQVSEEKQQERLITTAEEQAARVNNGGRTSQLIYLLEAYGEAGAVKALQDRHETNG